MRLPSYPKILQLGHRTIRNIFDDEVEITEKIDGSQLSFGKTDGELYCRSKSAELVIERPQSMFVPAVSKVKSIEHLLPEGMVFYSETLAKPKHNVLAYNRVPTGNIALFGIMDVVSKEMFPYGHIKHWAEDFEMEVVPLLGYGYTTVDQVLKFLDEESFLGGPKIEGVVVKNYKKDAMIGDVYYPYLVGKYVSESFKEKHEHKPYGRKSDKLSIDEYLSSFNTEARFQKAVQHLNEEGLLVGEPKDIGILIKELERDFLEECTDEIKEFLWHQFRREAVRRMSYQFPQWYKTQLLKGEVESNEGE